MPLPSLTPTQNDVFAALRSFLLSVLPSGTECVQGQDNRVPEPVNGDFVIMTPIYRRRLETNVDLYADCAFQGSINGSTLTVSSMQHGSISTGNQLFGSGVPVGTYVSGSLSGTGGTGTYQLSGTIGVVATEIMATGVFFALNPTEITIQLDIHGPNSADNVQIISTLFRDNYGVQKFAGFGQPPPSWAPIPPGGTVPLLPFDGIRPLYADDPKQIPFINAESQYENRWVLDACIQANQIVTAPQQFAAFVIIHPFIPVDTVFVP